MKNLIAIVFSLIFTQTCIADGLFNPGSGSGGGSGTVTSIATTCGVSGGTITTTGTITANITTRNTTTTTDTITNSDCGKVVTESNASPVAVAITTAGFVSGNYVTFKNLGAGLATYTPSAGTIGGNSTLALATGQSVDVYFDGTNFVTLPGIGAAPGGTSGQLQTNNGSGGFNGVANITSAQLPSGVNHPGYNASSIWYVPIGYLQPAAGSAPALTTAYCALGQIGGNSSATITALGIKITTGGSSNIQLAIYNNDTTVAPYRPGTLVDSTPNIANTVATSVNASLNATHSINPGWYWFCIQSNDTTVRYQTPSAVTAIAPWTIGSTTQSNITNSGLVGASTTTGITSFGTWPANMHGSTWTEVAGSSPFEEFQFSSVP